MMSIEPPHIVVSRLPLYLRALAFLQAEGRKITSSKELAERLGISIGADSQGPVAFW